MPYPGKCDKKLVTPTKHELRISYAVPYPCKHKLPVSQPKHEL